MNTTAGRYSLLGSIVPDDAGVVKKLRKAGAIILGKANHSEWAHGRGNLASGWSARGGQTTNAYYPNPNPCGSSSGSGFRHVHWFDCTLSLTSRAGGLTSHAGLIPISGHQDTVDPLTRSVADAAIVLSFIAGPDSNDHYTLAQLQTTPWH